MSKVIPIGLFVVLAISALCGSTLGATVARMMAPSNASDSIWLVPTDTKQSMLIDGAVGLAVGLTIGLVIWAAYGKLQGRLGNSAWCKLLQVGLGTVMGGALGATIMLGLLLLDYQEFQVALLDFNGAPLLMGAALAGSLGALLVALYVTAQMSLLLRILAVVGSGLAGIIVGALPGVAMAVLLFQIAWQTRPGS